jgi:hypothetical protein
MTFIFENPMLIYPPKFQREKYLGVVVLPIPAPDADGPPIFIKLKIPEYFPYERPHVTADLPIYYS